MPTLNGSYLLIASDARTGVIDDKIFALLLDNPPPEQWVITPVVGSNEGVVTIQTSDRSKAWTVPSDKEQEQITVKSFDSNSPAPNQIFRIVQPEIDSGRIQIVTNSSGYIIGRNRMEDMSLMPKRIVSRPDSPEKTLWLVQPL
jgi:hypothetical protein